MDDIDGEVDLVLTSDRPAEHATCPPDHLALDGLRRSHDRLRQHLAGVDHVPFAVVAEASEPPSPAGATSKTASIPAREDVTGPCSQVRYNGLN